MGTLSKIPHLAVIQCYLSLLVGQLTFHKAHQSLNANSEFWAEMMTINPN